MKKTIVLMAVLVTVSIALAGGYQAAQWGMTPDEVKKAMPDKKWKSYRGTIHYVDVMFENKVSFTFFFDKDNKLEKVIPLFQGYSKCMNPSFATMNQGYSIANCISKYLTQMFVLLKRALKEKYGPPKDCTRIMGELTLSGQCIDDDGIINQGNIVINVFGETEKGNMIYYEKWIVEDTQITLQLKLQKGEEAYKFIMTPIIGQEAQQGIGLDPRILIYQKYIQESTPPKTDENVKDKL